MRTKLITGISLVLIVLAGCQKREAAAPAPAASALDAETTPVAAETPTPAVTILSNVSTCPVNNPVKIDATNPGTMGNLGDTCVFYDGNSTANTALTWNWLATSNKKFKVESIVFVPTQIGGPTVFPYTLCPSNANTCTSSAISSAAVAGIGYYKVTTEAPVQVFNGRIIINR